MTHIEGMSLVEAAKQALEALEQSETSAPFGADGVVYWEGVKIHKAAITALRTAIEQAEKQEDEAKAVIDAARAAMDDSVEAYDSAGSIKISSHLAASLSLCLDEYDRTIKAAHGIGDKT